MEWPDAPEAGADKETARMVSRVSANGKGLAVAAHRAAHVGEPLRLRPFESLLLVFVALLGAATSSAFAASPLINEILFNPPGPDTPNEYVELRGTPNQPLPNNSFLVNVEGDAGGNPGTIHNLFNLSNVAFGNNGLLVLLQKDSPYSASTNAHLLINTDKGDGWGSGGSSSVNHEGENGQTELENASTTFFLIRADIAPDVGVDIDADDDGVPDGPDYASWHVLDSVGVLDGDGAGDFAYGAINFRRSSSPGDGAKALGTIVGVSFTPDYIARAGNTTGSTASDWVASGNLGGMAPQWILGAGNDTVPAAFSGKVRDDPGAPNFGAPPIAGVALLAEDQPVLNENGGMMTYSLALNTTPSGAVTLEIQADPQLEVSTDGGGSFQTTAAVIFTGTTPRVIQVRARDDAWIQGGLRPALVTHAIITSADSLQYPVGSFVASLGVGIQDDEFVLLNEMKVNPPGTNDAPFEYLELRGTPGAVMTNLSLLVLNGDSETNPGVAFPVFDLTGHSLGASGLLVVGPPVSPYPIPADTARLTDSRFDLPGGLLGNGTISFLLISTTNPPAEGTDLDAGDNGKLEGLPEDVRLIDSVGWSDGNNGDVLFGDVNLKQNSGTPDAATRFPGNSTALSADAWFNGNLLGTNGGALLYNPDSASGNLPAGTSLTPGTTDNTAPVVSELPAWSGVIGDPTNPGLAFTIGDLETDPATLSVTVTSSNAAVIPDSHLILQPGPAGARTLLFDPVGVGYSTITVAVTDGLMTNHTSFVYAASAQGRPGGFFQTGVSDASTALPITSELMLVGDDENEVIRLYPRHLSGPPLTNFDMTPFLGLTDVEGGVPREVDIEASTRSGARIYWIGSHSHANIAEFRTNRSRIFATDISGGGATIDLTYVGRYDYFKSDLVAWDNSNTHGKGSRYFGLEASAAEGVDPKADNGFNIEGLAMAPESSTTAYVGFRAPIVPATNRAYALIVPVVNFNGLAVSDGPEGSSVFGPPIELDLNGRGIRSIEGNTNGYLIVGGPSGDDPNHLPNDFRLYTWTGNPQDQPQERAADLRGLNPEGIVELPPPPWTPDSQIALISDNGRTDWYNDGTSAKHLPEPNWKKFRGDTVRLGAIVPPSPYIISITRTGSAVTVTWRAHLGSTYRLQFKARLDETNWIDLPGDVAATGPFAGQTDLAGGNQQRFYQVRLLP